MMRSFAIVTVALLISLMSYAQPKKGRKYDVSKPETDFTKRDLSGKDMSKHDLENSIFHFCNCKGTNFKSSNLRGCDFGSASVDKADMSDCDLTNSKFERAGADSTNFTGSDLTGADLSRCSCQKANFTGAILKNLKGLQDMTGADFSGADLSGANLQDTKDYSGKAIFKGAKYDKLTRWPRGFDVESSGAILVKSVDK